MPKNKIEDLRNILFETMERLLDPDDELDIDRAKTVRDVAQVVVNSAKVEVDFLKVTGGNASSAFMTNGTPQPQPLPKPAGELKAIKDSKSDDPALCLNCTLPTCDETSSQCLVQIERSKAA